MQTWTEALCRADSDGDGKTNGEELGDPDCTWTTGQQPRVSPAPSHPGRTVIALYRDLELTRIF